MPGAGPYRDPRVPVRPLERHPDGMAFVAGKVKLGGHGYDVTG